MVGVERTGSTEETMKTIAVLALAGMTMYAGLNVVSAARHLANTLAAKQMAQATIQ
jgi:hypothetical protein